jgi:DNA repair exonuclease SbcCD ATPase subunit
MTDCQDWLNELTYTSEQILNEDLAALKRMPDRSRIERYNEIKSNEEEFSWEFGKECSDFLTGNEEDRLRGELRLARLLLAASFYSEGELPRAMENDFIEAELQAVVEFDRYKQFDALSQEQIEGRIRRMEGEVYELVQDYTSTQIANMDELIDNPEVQQDVIERLVERYDDRRERIRQGFFVYVETHGMEHMVESIEEAVEAVADASSERKQIKEMLQSELTELEASLETGFRQQRKQLESQLHSVEHTIASETVDIDEVRTEIEDLGGIDDETLVELQTAIDRTQTLESKLDDKIEQLENARKNVEESNDNRREEVTEIIGSELEQITEQRSELRAEINRLQREREQIEHARDRLEDRQQDLETQVDDLEESIDTKSDPSEGIDGIDGSEVVTASTAKLFEMDYIGRFDTKMHEVDTLHLPDEDFEIPDGYWEGRSQRRNRAPHMVQLLEDKDGERVESYPTNPTARYEITESRYLGLSEQTEMIIGATVYSNLEAHAANGFDSAAADIDDLLSFVNEALREADRKEVPYLLGIASPTGWTDRLKKKIAADEFARTHYSRQVSICLVDLRDGELIYDESDPVVSDNISLFERAVGAERVTECVEIIQSEYIDGFGRETIGLEEITAQHGFDGHIVKRAFEQLENDGHAEQFYVDEQGLALDIG